MAVNTSSEVEHLDVQKYLKSDSLLGYGHFDVKRTKCINVLLVGRTQSGKSTIMNSLIDPQFPRERSGYSVTRDPQCNVLTIRNLTTNVIYQLNIIDTPGLQERRKAGEANRKDSELLNLASRCLEENITKLNIVCFVSEAGNTELNDMNTFKLIKEYLGDECSDISMMILTHCDQFSDAKQNKFKEDLKVGSAESKEMCAYCKLGIFSYGALDGDTIINNIQSNEDDEAFGTRLIESTLRRIERMRDDMLNAFIANAENAKPIKLLEPIVAAMKKTAHQAIETKSEGCVIS